MTTESGRIAAMLDDLQIVKQNQLIAMLDRHKLRVKLDGLESTVNELVDRVNELTERENQRVNEDVDALINALLKIETGMPRHDIKATELSVEDVAGAPEEQPAADLPWQRKPTVPAHAIFLVDRSGSMRVEDTARCVVSILRQYAYNNVVIAVMGSPDEVAYMNMNIVSEEGLLAWLSSTWGSPSSFFGFETMSELEEPTRHTVADAPVFIITDQTSRFTNQRPDWLKNRLVTQVVYSHGCSQPWLGYMTWPDQSLCIRTRPSVAQQD